jgi:hypothetical protein
MLTQPQQPSTDEPELGTAQSQLVSLFLHFRGRREAMSEDFENKNFFAPEPRFGMLELTR